MRLDVTEREAILLATLAEAICDDAGSKPSARHRRRYEKGTSATTSRSRVRLADS